MAFSAGGRRAATCSALNPPHEMPIMPTAPLHQGCAASQAMTSSASSCSCSAYSSNSRPLGFAAAADVDAHARIAVAGQVGMGQRVALMGAVALAVWQILQDRGNRISLGVVRQPYPGGQPRAVLQRDQRVLDDTYCTGKRRNDQTMLPVPKCAHSPLRRLGSAASSVHLTMFRESKDCAGAVALRPRAETRFRF